ncbi:hypothetical protein ES703_16839 [subsurface metagenome]
MRDKNIQLYKIGKKLGLSSKDINRTLFSLESKYNYIFKIFFKIIFFLIIIFLSISIIILGTNIIENTYPAGTLYSTVNIRELDRRKRIQKR